MALIKLLFAASMFLLAGCSFPDYVTSVEEPAPLGGCQGLLTASDGRSGCDTSCGDDCDEAPGCTTDQQCPGGYCSQGACVAASCSDGAKDGAETDVDCGGTDGCPACAVGQRCVSSYDCNGGGCVNGRCQAPSCGDGLQNQSETDVDCGGETSCDRCLATQPCEGDADCDGLGCAQGRCQPAGCDDQIRNRDETDVDCGGSCATCADFAHCAQSDDCTSSVCNVYAGICLAATCSDGVLNGNESAIDCGKGCPSRCGMMATCHEDADCQSNTCSEQRCVPSSATGQALDMTGWVATASSNFSPDTEPARALDGNLDTRWTNGTGQRPGGWFQLDMRATKAVFAVELTCSSNDDYPRTLRAFVSEDGVDFTPATPTVAGTTKLRLDFGRARIARYVKLELQSDAGNIWWRIDELRVLQ